MNTRQSSTSMSNWEPSKNEQLLMPLYAPKIKYFTFESIDTVLANDLIKKM